MTGNREEKAAFVFVGVIRESNSKFLVICLGAWHIPVISSLVIDWKGNDLNIRADAMIEKIETILVIFKLIPSASVDVLMDNG
jgi:acetylglutamate kinase